VVLSTSESITPRLTTQRRKKGIGVCTQKRRGGHNGIEEGRKGRLPSCETFDGGVRVGHDLHETYLWFAPNSGVKKRFLPDPLHPVAIKGEEFSGSLRYRRGGEKRRKKRYFGSCITRRKCCLVVLHQVQKAEGSYYEKERGEETKGGKGGEGG